MLVELIGAAFATARTDTKIELAIWVVLALVTIGGFYIYNAQGLSQKQIAKLESMEKVSQHYHLDRTLENIAKFKADGSINKGEYWTIHSIYKNESFDKNYELMRAKRG